MVFISPKNLITNFLRKNLTDPRNRAEDINTETFDGGGTEFQLTPIGNVSCINSVMVNSVEQGFGHYWIDFQNQKIIFYNATASGTNNVDITYKQGTSNWIYPDKALRTLSKTSFPRINVLVVGGSGERLGQYNSNVESSVHFQLDIWTKEDQTFTIDGIVYANDKLAEYLSYEITKSLRSNVSDMFPALYNYTLLGTPKDMAFDQEMECFHTVIDIEMKGVDISEGYS